jgi:hypothetical protein
MEEDSISVPTSENKNIEDELSVVNKDIALRAVLFAIIYYIITSPLVLNVIDKYSPVSVETLIIQSIIFGLVYYFLNVLVE